MMSAGDCLIQYEPCDGSGSAREEPDSFHIPRHDPHSVHVPQRLHGSSGSESIRHRGFHHSSNVLYEYPNDTTASRGRDDLHGSRGLCDPQRLSGDLQDPRFRNPPNLGGDQRRFSIPQGVHRPRRASNSGENRDPQRLPDRQEIHNSGRLRVDRLSGRSDDIHRPYSNLAAAAVQGVSDVHSSDQHGGRFTSMSVGSADSSRHGLITAVIVIVIVIVDLFHL